MAQSYVRQLVGMTLAVGLAACAPPVYQHQDGPVPRPTIYTNPLSYLEAFPLGEVSVSQLVQSMGVPRNQSEIEGKAYLSYELGEGYGLRQYVFEVSDGVVSDVRYHDQGPYNGSTARRRQGLE